MTETFGQSITREFFCLSDNEYINLPSQAPSIYLFSALPSMAVARAGTGADQSVSYWTEYGVSPFKRTWSYTAIADPQPTSSTTTRGYWEAVNFVINGAQKVTELRQIIVERPEGHDSTISTTASDVRNLWTPVTSYYEADSTLDIFIGLAVDHFKIDLKRRGLDWGRVQRLKEIRIPIAYKALAIAMRGQIGRDPQFEDLVRGFEAEYAAGIASITLPYNEENDGNLVEQQAGSSSVRIKR